MCTKIQPSVSIKPRTQALRYDDLLRTHSGMRNPFFNLFPRGKPFETRKSTTDVLASEITSVFFPLRFRITGSIPKSFLQSAEIYFAYNASITELTVTLACQGLLIPPSPIIIPKNSAKLSEYEGNNTFLRWLFLGYLRLKISGI